MLAVMSDFKITIFTSHFCVSMIWLDSQPTTRRSKTATTDQNPGPQAVKSNLSACGLHVVHLWSVCSPILPMCSYYVSTTWSPFVNLSTNPLPPHIMQSRVNSLFYISQPCNFTNQTVGGSALLVLSYKVWIKV